MTMTEVENMEELNGNLSAICKELHTMNKRLENVADNMAEVTGALLDVVEALQTSAGVTVGSNPRPYRQTRKAR